jgi:hypothetical protein
MVFPKIRTVITQNAENTLKIGPMAHLLKDQKKLSITFHCLNKEETKILVSQMTTSGILHSRNSLITTELFDVPSMPGEKLTIIYLMTFGST